MKKAYLKTQICTLEIVADERAVYEINFVNETKYKNQKNKILNLALEELNEYFKGNLEIFTTPIKLSGTNFEVEIYKNALKIPYGETLTYKELSKIAGFEKAFRATANALGKNKIPIIVPCHRVVSFNGLGGYSGFGGVETKKFLLNLEKVNV